MFILDIWKKWRVGERVASIDSFSLLCCVCGGGMLGIEALLASAKAGGLGAFFRPLPYLFSLERPGMRTRLQWRIYKRKKEKLVAASPIWDVQQRKMIRRIEGNAKCRHLKNFKCKGTLRQVFICLRPRTPHVVYSILIHTGRGEGGGLNQREGETGNIGEYRSQSCVENTSPFPGKFFF
jgi:hypothetical protein